MIKVKRAENVEILKGLTDSKPQLSRNAIYTLDVVNAGGPCMAKTYRSRDPAVRRSVGREPADADCACAPTLTQYNAG